MNKTEKIRLNTFKERALNGLRECQVKFRCDTMGLLGVLSKDSEIISEAKKIEDSLNKMISNIESL